VSAASPANATPKILVLIMVATLLEGIAANGISRNLPALKTKNYFEE
jgi:hypothetical protein